MIARQRNTQKCLILELRVTRPMTHLQNITKIVKKSRSFSIWYDLI